MSDADLYTPWREPAEQLRARNIGREDELVAARAAVRSVLRGKKKLPFYFFGPRGIGKSHLLAILAADVREEVEAAGAALIFIPEDIPELRTAQQIIDRISSAARGPRWRLPSSAPTNTQQRIVLFEGLDRQLRSLSARERQNLRWHLDREPIYLIATGISLEPALVGKDEAFYGAFTAWDLTALNTEQAGALLDQALGDIRDKINDSRRDALILLAGGSPRTLLALAKATIRHPERWASQQLYTVLQDFTAHYQMRFRDLSPQAQRIVECLADAPRELRPSELAAALDSSTASMSMQCGRLVDDGVVRRHGEGRNTWYALAEPLFRYWLEYRLAAWEDTRIGWLSQLIEILLSPTERSDLWLESHDQELRHAALKSLDCEPEERRQLWSRLRQRLRTSTSRQEIIDILERVNELPASPVQISLMLEQTAGMGFAGLVLRYESVFKQICGQEIFAVARLLKAITADARLDRSLEHFLDDIHGATYSVHDIPDPHERMSLWRSVGRLFWSAVPIQNVQNLSLQERQFVYKSSAKIQVYRVYYLGSTAAEELSIFESILLPEIHSDSIDLRFLLTIAVEHELHALFRHIISLLSARSSEDRVFLYLLPRCEKPGIFSKHASEIASIRAARGADEETSLEAWLSWAPSFCRLAEEEWQAALRSLPEHCDLPEFPLLQESLMVLARLAPGRFLELGEAVPAGWEVLFDAASALLQQVDTHEGGALHPELERARQVLEADLQRAQRYAEVGASTGR